MRLQGVAESDSGFLKWGFSWVFVKPCTVPLVKAPVQSLLKVLLLKSCPFFTMKDLRSVFPEVWAVTAKSQCRQGHLLAAMTHSLPFLLLQMGRVLFSYSLNTF